MHAPCRPLAREFPTTLLRKDWKKLRCTCKRNGDLRTKGLPIGAPLNYQSVNDSATPNDVCFHLPSGSRTPQTHYTNVWRVARKICYRRSLPRQSSGGCRVLTVVTRAVSIPLGAKGAGPTGTGTFSLTDGKLQRTIGITARAVQLKPPSPPSSPPSPLPPAPSPLPRPPWQPAKSCARSRTPA